MHLSAPSLAPLKFTQLPWDEWWGRRDSERLPLLIPRKLFILRTDRNDRTATKAERRYTAGTRSLIGLALFFVVLIPLITNAKAPHGSERAASKAQGQHSDDRQLRGIRSGSTRHFDCDWKSSLVHRGHRRQHLEKIAGQGSRRADQRSLYEPESQAFEMQLLLGRTVETARRPRFCFAGSPSS